MFMMMIMAMMTTGLVVLLSCCANLTYLLTTWTRFQSVQIQNTTEALTTTLLWERRPDQNKKGGKNQQQLWHPFNGIDWTDSVDSSNKKHIAPSLTRLGTFPHIHGCRRRRGGKKNKKRFLLLSKHVVAVVVAVILGHVSLIWLHGYLGFFLFVQNYRCLHSHGWMAMPLLLPRCLFWNRRHVHIVFMLPSSSVCVPSLLWPCSSNCGILNSMEDIADRSLFRWRIN